METWRRERARPAGVKVRAAAAAASMGLSEEMTLGLNEGARDDAGEGNDPGGGGGGVREGRATRDAGVSSAPSGCAERGAAWGGSVGPVRFGGQAVWAGERGRI